MSKLILFIGIIIAVTFSFHIDQGNIDVDDTLDIVTYEDESYKLERAISEFKDSFIEPKKELSILAFGDVMLGRYVRTLMDKEGMDYVFRGLKDDNGNFFTDADIVHANLEGPIFNEGRKGGTSMIFSFNEDIAPLLRNNGFDIVSIANNHARDMGWEGRGTTMNALTRSGVGWCGHPTDADYDSVYYGEKNNNKYAFVCFHDVTSKLNYDDAAALISEVKSNVDYVIVSIHWGYEYTHTPNVKRQKVPGRMFIDAGADVILGHHPHVVQPFEIYNGKFIFYSLGNAIFDQYWSSDVQDELAVKISFEGESTTAELFPMRSEKSVSRLMTTEEKEKWVQKFIKWGGYDEDIAAQIIDGVVEIE